MIAVDVAQDRNGQVVVQKAGRGRVRAEEIDVVIEEYIDPSAYYALIQLQTIKSLL